VLANLERSASAEKKSSETTRNKDENYPAPVISGAGTEIRGSEKLDIGRLKRGKTQLIQKASYRNILAASNEPPHKGYI